MRERHKLYNKMNPHPHLHCSVHSPFLPSPSTSRLPPCSPTAPSATRLFFGECGRWGGGSRAQRRGRRRTCGTMRMVTTNKHKEAVLGKVQLQETGDRMARYFLTFSTSPSLVQPSLLHPSLLTLLGYPSPPPSLPPTLPYSFLHDTPPPSPHPFPLLTHHALKSTRSCRS